MLCKRRGHARSHWINHAEVAGDFSTCRSGDGVRNGVTDTDVQDGKRSENQTDTGNQGRVHFERKCFIDKILAGQALSDKIDGMNLREELKRPVPFASLEQETLLNLLRVGDQLDNKVSRLFRTHGLTLSRFNVLRNLDLADRPLTCGEIGERMIQVVPAVTSLVDQLEKHDLVVRRRCQRDRRVVYIAITEEGRRLCEELRDPLDQLEMRLMGKMTQKDLKSLIRLLGKVRASIASAEEADAG